MAKYIFITSVEKKEANYPVIQVAKDDTPVPPLYPKGMAEKVDVYVESETIEARAFKDSRGNVTYIGLCKEAQDTIGVWLESFDNLGRSYEEISNLYLRSVRQNRELVNDCDNYVKEIITLRDYVKKEQEQLKFYRNMNFWQRLRFLFKIW